MRAVSEVLETLNKAVNTSCQAAKTSFDTLGAVDKFKSAADAFRQDANSTKTDLKGFMKHLNTDIRGANFYANNTTVQAQAKFQIAGEKMRDHAATSVERINSTEAALQRLR